MRGFRTRSGFWGSSRNGSREMEKKLGGIRGGIGGEIIGSDWRGVGEVKGSEERESDKRRRGTKKSEE